MSTTPSPPSTPAQGEVESGKLWAILSYVFPLTIVPLLQKDNDFALFHAKQGLVLAIFSIPTCFGCVVGGLILAVLGILNAVNGKTEPLPVIGQFGEQWFAGIKKGR